MTVTELDLLLPPQPTSGNGPPFYGVYSAIVTDVQDPDGTGRVRVRLPWAIDAGDDDYEAWARIATLMAGAERGTWFIPEPDDEVLVAFEGGDPRRPFVIGALWNGVDAPPESMDSENNIRSITSRSGITITFDDTSGSEKLTLETPAGHTIVCDDSARSLEMTDANGNQMTMDSSGVTINTSAKFSVSASTVEVSAGMVTVNAGMSKFSGVVQSDTVITNSVVSSSYTPGAGNIW